jgi:hypothetical protein
MIFLCNKHSNQPPNQKVVLPIAPFFLELAKIATFKNRTLDIADIADRTLKLTIQPKNDATSSTIFFGVKTMT